MGIPSEVLLGGTRSKGCGCVQNFTW
jgi:hypothetical protein